MKKFKIDLRGALLTDEAFKDSALSPEAQCQIRGGFRRAGGFLRNVGFRLFPAQQL